MSDDVVDIDEDPKEVEDNGSAAGDESGSGSDAGETETEPVFPPDTDADRARDAALKQMMDAISPGLLEIVKASRVLVVGAGGIGCELLKNLVLSGFRRIDLIDLDTIDVSNLNRQFLFRREHVGRSKAQVAREAALAINPKVHIIARHDNIKNQDLGVDFFKRFTIVMNALDNIDARRHVNRLCLAAEIPLIESGTQGYLGQVQPIQGGKSECFECQPQNTPKTFAVCTIRNTPDRPVHCIVWAKFIFGTLFGAPDDSNIMSDLKIDPTTADDPAAYARRVFTQFFETDVRASLEIKERWEKRTPPTPLVLDHVLKALPTSEAKESVAARDQRVLSVAENAELLLQTIQRILTDRKDSLGSMEFDKDDRHAMDFVSAASNLRMAVFGIPLQSFFTVKGIAGNIVHAIATTNAMAAGLLVIEGLKMMAGKLEKNRVAWINPMGPRVIAPQLLSKPSASCYVCGKQRVTITINCDKFSLKDFFDLVQKRLGMSDPAIDVVNRENGIGIREDCSPEYLSKPCSSEGVRINDGAIVAADDYSQSFQCNIFVRHEVLDEEKYPEGFIIQGTATASTEPAAPAAPEKESASESVNGTGPSSAPILVDDDDDLVMIDESKGSARAAPPSSSSSSSAPAPSAPRGNSSSGSAAVAGSKRSSSSLASSAPAEVFTAVDGDVDITDDGTASESKRRKS